MAFLQISLVEECFKFFSFKLSGLDNKKSLPAETFLYCLIPAVSFGPDECTQTHEKNMSWLDKDAAHARTITTQNQVLKVMHAHMPAKVKRK